MNDTNKGANYVVAVTRFYEDHGEPTFYTLNRFFHDKDAAINKAKELSKKYGCGKFEDTMCDGSFALRAVSPYSSKGDVYWVGVQEIKTED